MEVHILPLRERPEDIPLLKDHFIRHHNPELKKNYKGIEEEAVRIRMSLPWKGNVREFDNVIEHTMILAEGVRITVKDLPASILASSQGNAHLRSISKMLCGNSRSSISCGHSNEQGRTGKKLQCSSTSVYPRFTARSKN